MRKLHLDFETRSCVDIKTVGLWKYAAHPSTQIMALAVALDDETPKILDDRYFASRNRRSELLVEVAQDPNIVLVAHNAHFEYAIWEYIMHRRLGYPSLWDALDRWDCTEARAFMCGLPGKLGECASAIGAKVQKDLTGRQAMLALCKPAPMADPITGDPFFWTEEQRPDLYKRMYAYCAVDVETERELDRLLPPMPPAEKEVWKADLILNRRGVQVDVPLARKAKEIARVLTENLNAELHTKTCPAPTTCHAGDCQGIDKASRVTALGTWLKSRGVPVMDSFDKAAVTELLQDPLVSDEHKEIINIRRQVGRSSTAKYETIIEAASEEDGRVRGAIQYHGAHTGRFSGRLIQPQNYPQGYATAEAQEPVAADIMALPPLDFAAKYGDKAMDALSQSLRGTIIAAPGKELLSADFSAIEARVVFWCAGEEGALSAYRRGESPYVEMAEAIFAMKGVGKKTHPFQYDIGKRTVLGAGFGMGRKRFRDNIYEETAKKGTPLLISEELAEKSINAYRAKYPQVVALWKAANDAATAAVRDTKEKKTYAADKKGRVRYGLSADGRFLCCRLPSGRLLRYFRPSIKPVWKTWCTDPACPHLKQGGRIKDCPDAWMVDELHYWAKHPDTKQWCEIGTYGGAEVENFVQAIARDFMVEGMLRCEKAGFPIVLNVHDELVAEVSIGEVVDLKLFLELMCKTPKWGEGCPVTAEGWIGARYRK